MADPVFSQNELRPAHPELARQFEREIGQAVAALPGPLECRIRLDGPSVDALERVSVILVGSGSVVEWQVALPITEGDARRAAESALGGRRARGERRHSGRARIDRRGRP